MFIEVGLFYAVTVSLALLAALKYRDWRIVIGSVITVITLWLVFLEAGAGVEGLLVSVIGGTVALALTIGAIAVAGAVAIAGAGVAAVAGVVAGVISVSQLVWLFGLVAAFSSSISMRAAAGAGSVAQDAAGTVSIFTLMEGGLAAAAMTTIYVLLGWYLSLRAMQTEEPMLALLQRNTLMWRCWGGTQFSGATLAHTDFSEADLTAAHFGGAKLQQPNFTHAKNLHLAWTYATPLEHRLVRTLLTEGRLDSQDFSNLNLRGLSFKGLDLTGCNFYQTDLSETDFNGCDLAGTDLTEAMVLGTCFSNATMTGAIIDNWRMDKHTQFDGVICDFVFTKRNKKERNPPQGDFKPGAFSKLYQEISTVDFIAQTPDELTALIRAIISTKQQGRDIEIQSLERKNESVVVRTQSDESIDKAAVYAEVKEQMGRELLALQQEKQLLLQKVDMQEQQADTLKQFLKLAIESPKTVNDNSRHYSNITAHDSALNFGDGSTVSNHIEQVADAELKAELQTLQQLLANSHLADIDKQQAHQAVDDLAAVSQKPQAERKSLARRSLAFLKDLQQDLSSVAELGEQYGKLLLKVAAWF